MDRRGSAARTGRAEIAQNIREHHGMDGVTGGDPDVDIEDAYFTGEEAPGGDNPTPDQDIVDDIGKALGVTYDDNEELKGADKLEERDKHRWELDPGVGGGLQGAEVGLRLRDIRTSRVRSLSRTTREHFLDDLVDVLPRRVDDDRVVGGVERRRGARAIDLVALREQRRDVGDRRGTPVCAGSLARRRARSSGDASRYSFTSASGNTTVPMSRPSITIPPPAPICRCCSTSTARTRGSRATPAAARSISGVRIARVTSIPSIVTCVPVTSMRARSASAATAASSSSGTPSRSAFQPTARYIAPLST